MLYQIAEGQVFMSKPVAQFHARFDRRTKRWMRCERIGRRSLVLGGRRPKHRSFMGAILHNSYRQDLKNEIL